MGPFWPQGYNLNKLGIGLLDYVALILVVSDKKIEFFAYILAYVKRDHIWPQWYNLDKLGQGPYYILNIKAVGLAVPD